MIFLLYSIVPDSDERFTSLCILSKSSGEFECPKPQEECKESGAFGYFGDVRPGNQDLMQYDNVDDAAMAAYERPVLLKLSSGLN